jgi:hypothetical protein
MNQTRAKQKGYAYKRQHPAEILEHKETTKGTEQVKDHAQLDFL